MTLACAAALALSLSARGQDVTAALPAPPPLAGAVVHGEADADPQPQRLADALGRLAEFESFDDGQSVAALVRILLEAAAAPGSRVALLGIEGGAPVIAAMAPGTLELDGDDPPGVQWWNGNGVAYVLFHGDREAPDPAFVATALAGLEDTFANHRPDANTGLELMLDLENLRRAWPASLEDGPARRVVAVTGLANARKVHVHVPATGPVRLAYSSRAEPADRVTVKLGPDPQAGTDIGLRLPNMFDAGLRVYAVALGAEARAAFGQRFQGWMGEHGNRLRGLIQAAEVGLTWSVRPVDAGEEGDGGLRIEATIPIRQGVSTQALIDAAMATLRGSGFTAEGKRAQMQLPETLAHAMGGRTLSIEVDDSGEPVLYRLSIE